MPKITDAAKFLNWSWWFWLTPNLHGTVFARPGFHLQVFIYLAIANLVFWNEYFAPDYQFIDDDNTLAASYIGSWAGRLMVFVLTGFMFRLVSAYWVDARKKAGQLLRGMAKVMDILTIYILIMTTHAPRSSCTPYGGLFILLDTMH